MSPTLAYLGLGNMGRGMSKNLVEKGKLSSKLILYNRTTAKAEALSQKLGTDKTQVAKTIDEAVQGADIIFSCVADDKSILSIVEAALKTDVKGKLFVDCSTVDPSTTNHISKIITEKGGEFVACPVWGPPPAADAGTLICVLAGPAASVDKVRPYTTGVIGRAVVDLTDQEPGKATLSKLVGNTFIINMVATLSEGMTLAEKSGMGIDALGQFVELVMPGPYHGYFNRMKTGDYYKRDYPLMPVDLIIKDADHAINLGKACGVKLPSLEAAKSHLVDAKAIQGEGADMASSYGAVRKESGLPFEV